MAHPASRSWLSALVSLGAIYASISPASAATANPSTKRGLVFTPNVTHPRDDYIWAQQPTDITWYYNYGASPSSVFSNVTQDDFEFVPMLWGAPSDASDTTFLTTVKGLITGGRNITHVMTFNEPDGPAAYGGSNVDPTMAAKVWLSNIVPLQEMGVKVGLPACTGGWGGIPWTDQFLGNCSKLISASTGGKTKNCTYDFVPLHWYGNFEGLASHIGQWRATYNASNATIWVTEYNNDNQDLSTTQDFFNTTAEYMDRLTYVERYSFFGAFRSIESNVGPNAAMLSAGGELTDIGAWYMGRSATGVKPTDKSSGAGALLPSGWSVFALTGAAAFAFTAVLF